ncbi:MAG TPA: PP2C family protein-serine/threonine phosphatase [Candidatus Limnocylindrales bacterium]|nr:PP2C family protein-serine/threonine phosphatase [Candidatus Limnocylindrales bacterium]
MSPEAQVLAMLRGQLIEICFGTTFIVIGLAAVAAAAIRRRTGVSAIVWMGIWSAAYGILGLSGTPAFVAALPGWLQTAAPYVRTGFTYLMVVIATMAWRELSLGKVRHILGALSFAGLAIGVPGFAYFVFAGSPDKLMPWNNLLAVVDLLVLLTVILVPSLSRKYLVLPGRGALAVGSIVFVAEAVFVNLSRPFGHETARVWDSLAFAVLLFSFGYVALQMVFGNERRLLSIENELEIARQLQFSILPTSVPELRSLRVAANYLPMTAVAGDFYEFLAVDQHRAGFLVADVSGHGVPAALIASMIKVAAQSVTAWADDPGEVLRRLSGILSGQLRGQFVSAAYLWIDTEAHRARYSAAGHPPLLCWRASTGELQRIESNGMLFGVMPDAEYPVCDVALETGDRVLMYTDGVVEPENAAGESFGDLKLEQVVRGNQLCTASELSEHLLAEVRNWQPASMTQQDDITLLVIDVL